MYKFYQEQPENNWVYHPMRDENREDNEKKDSNNSFAEPKADYFSFGNQESPMGQGQNKRQNFAAHMLPANNRIGTIQAQPQKSNALPGSIATGNEKLKDWKNKLKGALDVIKDIISKTTFSRKSKRSVQNQAKSQNETVVKISNTQA